MTFFSFKSNNQIMLQTYWVNNSYLQSVPAANTYDVQCVDLVINSFELGLL